jgi:hypothetical protein
VIGSPPSPLPEGFIDPVDPSQTTPILASVLRELGWPGLIDLLTRIPGFQLDAGRPGRGLRRSTPGRLTAGENVFVLATPLICEHVVGGIVLSRSEVSAGAAPALLAKLIAETTRRLGQVDDASAALSAIRDIVAP